MIEAKDFEATNENKTLRIKGELKLFPVVKIPLEQLKYNKQNGRIATWISENESENGPLPENVTEANNTIEKFIVDSNPDALKKTKNNIEKFDQMEAAVVLSDGTIVDGNRRFTALRLLSKEGKGQKFNYIKAVVLPNQTYSPKEIKALELNLQHAKEERVDYNPIDRLVDIYRDLLSESSAFTPEEYATEVDMPIKDVKKEMELAQLLVDYLEFIHQTHKYYIARQQNLNGPLREIQRILKSKKIEEDDAQDAKELLFSTITTVTGDATRKIRSMANVITNRELLHNTLDELDETLNDLDESFESEFVKDNAKERHTIEVPVEISGKINNVVEKKIETTRLAGAQKAPLEALGKANNFMGNVDVRALKLLADGSAEDNEEIKILISAIKSKLNEIEETI